MKSIVLILLFSMSLMAQSEAKKEYNILVIFSYVPSSWNTNGLIGVKNAFDASNLKLRAYDYVYDNIQVRNKNAQKDELAKIKNLIKTKKIDGIVIFDDEASDDLITELKELNLPIAATGINKNRNEIKWLDKNSKISIIYERYPFEKSIKLLKKMDAGIKKIKILTTENESSNRITNQLLKKLANTKNTIAGITLSETHITKEWEDWKKVIINTKGDDEALFILVPWNVYKDGVEIDLREMGRFYQANSKVPSIGIVDINTQMGFLASFYVHSEDLGFQAGSSLITHLIADKSANNIEDTVKKTRFVLNKERMNALGLKIPLEVLDMATIKEKVELKVKR